MNRFLISARTFLIFVFFTCALVSASDAHGSFFSKKNEKPREKKYYLGLAAIQNTEAYEIFLRGSKSETAKLYYLVDRIKVAKDLHYLFEGGRYDSSDAEMGGMWAIWHHHQIGEGARAFIFEEVARFPADSRNCFIQFPDGSTELAYVVLLNELDLLEETLKQNEKKENEPEAGAR